MLLASVLAFSRNIGVIDLLEAAALYFRKRQMGPHLLTNDYGQLPIQDAYVGSNRPRESGPFMKPTSSKLGQATSYQEE